jgi:DNA helicase TIP49 (TBP-interacting protein)
MQNIFEKIYSFEFSKTRIKNQALRKYITMKLINKFLYFCNKNN